MSTNSVEPGLILFGQTRRRVLAWLFGHPDESFYFREIVRHTGAAQGAVQRELATLTRAGLVQRTVSGRQVYFQVNRSAPVFPELQRLVAKTAGFVQVVRAALAPLAERVNVALVFGSAARGELQSASDIDVLVVSDLSFSAVVEALSAAQEQLGREVNPTVYPPAEFRAKIHSGHAFLTTVLSEPHVFVVGGPDELGRLGAQRLAQASPDHRPGSSRPPRRRRARSR